MTNWLSKIWHQNEKTIVQGITYAFIIFTGISTVTLFTKLTGIGLNIQVGPTENIEETKGPEIIVPEETPGVVNVVGKDQYIKDLESFELATDKVDYIIKNGENGIDFIIAYPNKQPSITGNSKEETNKILWKYIDKYRSEFTLPKGKKEGYIIFVTTRSLPNNRDIFLGISGLTKGVLHKEQSIEKPKTNRYIFNLKKVPVEGFNEMNLFSELSSNGKIQIGAFVGEPGNRVEQIVLVFY